MSRGNKREIPFVGVTSVVHNDESLPASANRVKSVIGISIQQIICHFIDLLTHIMLNVVVHG